MPRAVAAQRGAPARQPLLGPQTATASSWARALVRLVTLDFVQGKKGHDRNPCGFHYLESWVLNPTPPPTPLACWFWRSWSMCRQEESWSYAFVDFHCWWVHLSPEPHTPSVRRRAGAGGAGACTGATGTTWLSRSRRAAASVSVLKSARLICLQKEPSRPGMMVLVNSEMGTLGVSKKYVKCSGASHHLWRCSRILQPPAYGRMHKCLAGLEFRFMVDMGVLWPLSTRPCLPSWEVCLNCAQHTGAGWRQCRGGEFCQCARNIHAGVNNKLQIKQKHSQLLTPVLAGVYVPLYEATLELFVPCETNLYSVHCNVSKCGYMASGRTECHMAQSELLNFTRSLSSHLQKLSWRADGWIGGVPGNPGIDSGQRRAEPSLWSATFSALPVQSRPLQPYRQSAQAHSLSRVLLLCVRTRHGIRLTCKTFKVPVLGLSAARSAFTCTGVTGPSRTRNKSLCQP